MSQYLTLPAQDAARDIRQVLRLASDEFVSHGVLDTPALDGMVMFCEKGGEADGNPSAIRIPVPIDAGSAAQLHLIGNPSKFGKASETVLDESYRMAREILPSNFGFNIDIIRQTGLLRLIRNTHTGNRPFMAKLLKLNTYGEGGFFKAHRDTPHGAGHVGSLVICLPSAFTGGELVLRHRGREVVVDWGTTLAQTRTGHAEPMDDGRARDNQAEAASAIAEADTGEGRFGWAFFYSDCEHEVLPVKSGFRITLAYDIYRVDADFHPDLNVENHRLLAIEEGMREILKRENLREGGTLGFGLQFSYPREFGDGKDQETKFLDRLPSRLKAADRVLYRALSRLQLKPYFKAIYEIQRWDWELEDCPTDPQNMPREDREAYVLAKFGIRNGLYMAPSIDVFTNKYVEGEKELLTSTEGVARAGHIIWVAKHLKTSSLTNDYTAYGNEAQSAFKYVHLAMLVDIESVEKRFEGVEQL